MPRSKGATPALKALASSGIAHTLHEYHHDPRSNSYGLEAASALGVEPGRVFKTLVATDGTRLVVGIVPVHRHLDLKALAAVLGVKRLSMADPAEVERATGMVVGGISPVGQRKALSTVLDGSASDHETILVSGGRRGLDVELAPGDLVEVTGAVVAEIAAG